MSQTILSKAKQYLSDGQVLVLKASTASAEFAVQGSANKPYIVSVRGALWNCDCPAQVDVCAHIQACKLIYKASEGVSFFPKTPIS